MQIEKESLNKNLYIYIYIYIYIDNVENLSKEESFRYKTYGQPHPLELVAG